jgi:hypothetical protein
MVGIILSDDWFLTIGGEEKTSVDKHFSSLVEMASSATGTPADVTDAAGQTTFLFRHRGLSCFR